MNYLDEFNDEWLNLYQQALERVNLYGYPFNEKARTYITKSLNPIEKKPKNYISYFLPFWIKELTGLSNEVCSKISLACSFGMLSFFIQDDLMDEPSFNKAEDFALAQLFAYEMQKVFLELFESGSVFWNYYGTYLKEWAEGVTGEASDDYFVNSPLLVAKKASPVKLGSTAALLLSQQSDLIPSVEHVVDLTLVSLQMSDDWLDWEEDLVSGSYNCLVSHIQHIYRPEPPLTAKAIKNHIYVQNALMSYAEQARLQVKKAVHHLPDLTYLHAFHRDIADILQEAAYEIELKKRSLLSGGFYYNLLYSTKT